MSFSRKPVIEAGSVPYHLHELDVAMNRDNLEYCMPQIGAEDKTILDIGCGIGQLFVSIPINLSKGGLLVGLDVDMEALQYGIQHFKNISYVNADAHALPFCENRFNLIVSRVSLVYTNFPRAISEISRVLKPDGKIWFSLHGYQGRMKDLSRAICALSLSQCVRICCVLVNGLVFHCFGRIFRIPLKNKYESFQTIKGMNRLLGANGFVDISISYEKFLVVMAAKKG